MRNKSVTSPPSPLRYRRGELFFDKPHISQYSKYMKNTIKFISAIFLITFVLSGCSAQDDILIINDAQNNPLVQNSPTPRISPTFAPTPAPTPSPKPKIVQYNVPFASQAPLSNWDDLHNEACEEASMIMADSFYHKKTLDKNIMEEKIQTLVKWEGDNGYTVDVTANEVAEIIQKYFFLKAEVKPIASAQDIINELDKGKLVIVPAAGRLLGNPNYKTPGPLYHMLLVRGYDLGKLEIITNDPGTRKGEGYRYSYDVFINAIHDWPKLGRGKNDVTEEEMNNGDKVMIVVGLD